MSSPAWLDVGLPTLDRPFGIAVWPIFEHVWTLVFGFKPQNFVFTPGVTPMATLTETVVSLVAYYIIIFGGRELMRDRPAMQLNFLFKIHNLYLTLISGALLVLFMEQIIPTIARHGLFFSICKHAGGWTDKLVILYYLNYLTKYLELIDTVFLFLKKKPLTFLHTYHHGATAALCYSQLLGHTAVSWVVISLNLMVHVVMYWYYFQAARGVKIWWKRYITILQITQFVIDLGFVYFSSYTYFMSEYFPWMPNIGSCAGEEFAAFAGMGILSSYLLLFLSFYAATYKKPAPKKRGRATSALIEMKDEKVPTVGETKRRFSGSSPPGVAATTTSRANGNAPGSTRVTRSRKA